MPKKNNTTRVNKDNLPSPIDAALSMVAFGKPLDPVLSISQLLNSQETLTMIAEACAVGASVMSIEMKLGLPPDMLKNWLRIGKKEGEGAYYIFYIFFQRAMAEARMQAESRILIKDPLKWLSMMDTDSQLATQAQQGVMTVHSHQSTIVPKSEETTDSTTGQVFLEMDTETYVPPPFIEIDTNEDTDD